MIDEFITTTTILGVSWAGVALVFLWKIAIPWSESFLRGRNKGLEKRVRNIEENDVHELKSLKADFNEFRKEAREKMVKLHERIDVLLERISRIEGRLNGMK